MKLTTKVASWLVALSILFFWLGYESHKHNLFPLSSSIPRLLANQEFSRSAEGYTIQSQKQWGLPLPFYPPNYPTGARYMPYLDVTNRTEVDCPNETNAIVILAFGQSNSANFLGTRTRSSSGNVINFLGNGKCYLAEDPMLGATGNTGSLWVKFGEKLSKLKDKKVVIATIGVGGSSITQWVRGNYLADILDLNLKALREKYNNVDYFMYVQGETDIDMKPEEYSMKLENIAEVTKNIFPKSVFALSSTTYCNGNKSQSLASIQKKIATSNPGFLWLGNTDTYSSIEYRYDNCHLSSEGANSVINMFLEKFAN